MRAHSMWSSVQINGKEVVTDAHSLELLVAGLYQPQANWPARLQSFIPRGGVSSATVARTQSALSAGGDSARSPKVASDPRAQQGNGASRGHDNSSATGGQIIAVSIEKGAGPIGMTFAGPRNAQDPRVGVFITKVRRPRRRSPAPEHFHLPPNSEYSVSDF